MPYLQLNYCLTSGHFSGNAATDTCRNQLKAFRLQPALKRIQLRGAASLIAPRLLARLNYNERVMLEQLINDLM